MSNNARKETKIGACAEHLTKEYIKQCSEGRDGSSGESANLPTEGPWFEFDLRVSTSPVKAWATWRYPDPRASFGWHGS
ncbi:hypothetical protein T265_04505 [Opisthorchis viverrini]|uniref:Uncharacterized protein n=1 Tax=Opisthorchis viverrini TaxID=6198 RepID=A0A074ZNP4_OPIVI|nr:hypothetical protein T265_04505 [Opisthorchis viverrini]KER28716.1 hypothetical protein T265_04505 [Opisthorchis viverrini]